MFLYKSLCRISIYRYFKHGVHLKVVTLVIHGDGVGRCAQIAQGAGADQEEQRYQSHHRYDGQGVDAGQPVANHPGTAPHVDADDAKDGGIQPGDGIVGESSLVGMYVILEEVLRDGKYKVTQAADHKGGQCGKGLAIGKEQHTHQLPGPTPIGDHAWRHDQAGEQHVQQFQEQLVKIPAGRVRCIFLAVRRRMCAGVLHS